jgi:hypothetical protein
MDNTPPVLGLGFHTTPTSTIVTGGVFPPSMLNQMMGVIHSTIDMSTSRISSLVVNPTQILSADASFSSTSNTFLYGMSSMDMFNAFVSSHPTSQSSNVGAGSTSTPYKAISWGRGHIPLSSPFIQSRPFQSSIANLAWGWGTYKGSGSQSSSIPSTSNPFTLYGGDSDLGVE